MNKTNSMTVVVEEGRDKKDAQNYLRKEYPDIEYLEEIYS